MAIVRMVNSRHLNVSMLALTVKYRCSEDDHVLGGENSVIVTTCTDEPLAAVG